MQVHLRVFILFLFLTQSFTNIATETPKRTRSDQEQLSENNDDQSEDSSATAEEEDEEILELNASRKKARISNEILESEIQKTTLQIEKMRKERELNRYVFSTSSYEKKPYKPKKQTLNVSDRKIHLDGPINRETTDRIIRQINFYNNKKRGYPIFLFINSPGGSVIQGFKLLDAINYCPSPVYVIVKEFAASMAAVITAQAKLSFALENAILLFHEPSTLTHGNTSNLRENLDFMEDIEQKLMGPLLEKFNYTSIEEWRKDLYKNSVTGDWTEFAGDAIKLKWVNNIVKEIRDTSSFTLEENQDQDQKYDSEEDSNKGKKKKTKKKKSRQAAVTYESPFDFNFIYSK